MPEKNMVTLVMAYTWIYLDYMDIDMVHCECSCIYSQVGGEWVDGVFMQHFMLFTLHIIHCLTLQLCTICKCNCMCYTFYSY